MTVLDEHIEDILKFCELNKMRTLSVFGSDPVSYTDEYFNLKFNLRIF